MVLTELGIEGWTGAAVLAAKSGGGETELASWVEGGGAPGSWTPQIDAGCSCGEARGSGGRNRHRGEDKRRQWHLPAAAVLAEGCGGAGGSGVELWGEDGEEKVAGPNYRGDPGISAGRSGIMIPASSPGISGALRSREGRGKRGLTRGAGWSAAGRASRGCLPGGVKASGSGWDARRGVGRAGEVGTALGWARGNWPLRFGLGRVGSGREEWAGAGLLAGFWAGFGFEFCFGFSFYFSFSISNSSKV